MLSTLVHLLILLLILGVVFYLFDYVLARLPLPEPLRWVAKVIPVVIALVLVLEYLVPLAKW